MNAFSKEADPQRGSPRPTLVEVAKRAGVSRTTASLVLSGKAGASRISQETAARVEAAARELDYSPNLLGRSLHHRTTQALAFFNGFRTLETDDLYMLRLSTSLEHAVGSRRYDLLVHCDYNRTPEELYRLMDGGRADGVVLFAPQPDDPLFPYLRSSRLPVVLLNAVDPQGVLPSVQDDLDQGMELALQVLDDYGHRHIGYFHAPAHEASDVKNRLLSLQKHARNINVRISELQFQYGFENLARPVAQVMSEPDRPTALITSTDRIAYLLVDALQLLGYKVPQDVSVVGYDGIHWPSATHHIVGSVVVDLPTACQTAVDLLLAIVRQEPQNRPRVTKIPVSFNPGTTIGPPRAIRNGANKQ